MQDVYHQDKSSGNGQGLSVSLDGYEGPMDVLLSLAREQKIDLSRLSVALLAEQYLAYVLGAERMRIELAAEYLVMAAWLAFLKSRLLLPAPSQEEKEDAERSAEMLAFHLKRLDAMQKAAAMLSRLPQMGRDSFPRGVSELEEPSPVAVVGGLYDLLKLYKDNRNRGDAPALLIRPPVLATVEEALARLRELIGSTPGWSTLSSFLPRELMTGSLLGRSAVAAGLVAALELAKEGKAVVRQDMPFGDIMIRSSEER
jgi:segregation and condensation protein A